MNRTAFLRRLALGLLASASLVGCGSAPLIVEGSDSCMTDSDCVPAVCCHAAACVARVHAPICTDTACTPACRPGTIDCGGGCFCHNGLCAARIVR